MLMLSIGTYAQTSETPADEDVVLRYAEKMPEPPYDVYKKISEVLKYPKRSKEKRHRGTGVVAVCSR